MAGLGRKVFTVGEILTAANVNGYLMDQSVMVFDNAAARGSALGTAVSEGMISYRKDSNIVEQYDVTSWSPVGVDSFTTTGIKNQILISNGTAGVVWADSLSPFLLIGA